jgi:hypothetical protein
MKPLQRNTALVALVVVSIAAADSGTTAYGSARLAQADQTVTFNTQTLKYHCPSCQWAVKCTKNCVTVSPKEAQQRGGVPCKVCGGTCKR